MTGLPFNDCLQEQYCHELGFTHQLMLHLLKSIMFTCIISIIQYEIQHTKHTSRAIMIRKALEGHIGAPGCTGLAVQTDHTAIMQIDLCTDVQDGEFTMIAQVLIQVAA